MSENYKILTQSIQQIPDYVISVSTLPEILNSTNTIIRLWNELVSVYIQSLQYFSNFTKFDIGTHLNLINEIRLNKFSIPPEYSELIGNSNNEDGMAGMGAAIGMERMEIAGLIQWVWEQYLPFLRLTPEQNMEIRNRIWYCLKVWVERQSSTLPLLNLFQPLFSYLLDRLHSYIQTLPVLKSLPKTTYKQCIQLISVAKEYYKEYCDKLIGDLRDVVIENGDTRRRTGIFIDGGLVVSKKTGMGESRPKKAMTVEKKPTATFVEDEEEYDWFGRKWEDCEELLRKAGVLS
ncbi:hypothetical protein BKA69DRAFT_1055135 [Paraphysoderma sedebokerense]|nr:hypothetical protein BKA69DRAFT_1055135 [Paraphysoderma sedebokerense]